MAVLMDLHIVQLHKLEWHFLSLNRQMNNTFHFFLGLKTSCSSSTSCSYKICYSLTQTKGRPFTLKLTVYQRKGLQTYRPLSLENHVNFRALCINLFGEVTASPSVTLIFRNWVFIYISRTWFSSVTSWISSESKFNTSQTFCYYHSNYFLDKHCCSYIYPSLRS